MKESKKPKRDLRPALVYLTGDLLAVPIPLERKEVILGRALRADVRINDTKISRRHAKIVTETDTETGQERYILQDLVSSNGTLLNGQKIVEEVLQNGDKIALGEHLFRFEMLDEIDREYQRQIRRLIYHDDLTGLLSSRSFFSELRRESARAQQEKKTFCVLMMDIDHFKDVNDTYGHLTGSRTLEEIGLSITNNLRVGDVAARFGGEEFAAFLLNADLAQGVVGAERIRSEIENFEFSIIKQGKVFSTHHVTISIGVARFPEDSTDPIELIEMADSALYQAKREGRNRVCTYHETELEDQPFHSLPSREEE